MREYKMKTPLLKVMALSLMVIPALSGCRHSSPGNPMGAPVPVNITEVRMEKVSFYDDYPGTAVALNEVDLRSEVSGFITGIFFREGDFVKKGTKLYEIDRSRYIASYGQAKANVDIAGANVERARRYVERYTRLSEQDAIAKQRLDDAQTDFQNAGLQLVSAQAGLVKAQTDLNYSLIMAPFDGTIGLSQVKMGALISPGQTLLNTISSDDPMGVDFVINEKELGRFQELAGKKSLAGDSTFRISLPDNSVYPENGKIAVIDRAIDPRTGTIRMRLVFPNHERKLRSGLSCLVHVLNASADMQIVVPQKSLLEQMSEYFVFVVDSQKVNQTKVTLGAQLKGKAIVTSGLREGQQIVTDGIQKLRNGAAVVVEVPGPMKEKNK
jgi:membrane fusion protein (multidrug efflux system)